MWAGQGASRDSEGRLLPTGARKSVVSVPPEKRGGKRLGWQEQELWLQEVVSDRTCGLVQSTATATSSMAGGSGDYLMAPLSCPLRSIIVPCQKLEAGETEDAWEKAPPYVQKREKKGGE